MQRAVEQLTKSGIKPSYQRVKILEYLMQEKTHPTADQMYHQLKSRIPTLSKATVYNTLHAFAKHGLIRAVTTNQLGTRYDFVTNNHGHFLCLECDRIFDFPKEAICQNSELEGFTIYSEEVVLKGICRDCAKNS